MSQASCLCSSPQKGGDERCEDNGCPKAPPFQGGCSPHGIRRKRRGRRETKRPERSFRSVAGFEPALACAITNGVPSAFDRPACRSHAGTSFVTSVGAVAGNRTRILELATRDSAVEPP